MSVISTQIVSYAILDGLPWLRFLHSGSNGNSALRACPSSLPCDAGMSTLPLDEISLVSWPMIADDDGACTVKLLAIREKTPMRDK